MNRLKDAMTIAMVYNVFVEGSACIAGGCLRDMAIGSKEPKDIDLLIEWEGKVDYDELYIMADRLGYAVMFHGEDYGDMEDQNLRTVFTLTKEGELPIDVLFLNCSTDTYIENFSCGISKIWLLGKTLCKHADFRHAISNEVLQFTGNVSESYRERMIRYFPTYKAEQVCQANKT